MVLVVCFFAISNVLCHHTQCVVYMSDGVRSGAIHFIRHVATAVVVAYLYNYICIVYIVIYTAFGSNVTIGENPAGE